MIRKIELHNFKNHKRKIIEFSDGVNVITGTSDSGKSAVLKGIYWTVFNKPSGFSFKNKSAKPSDPTSVSITFDSGDNVTRFRGGTHNKYLVNSESFSELRSGIPDEVSALLNITDVNMQTQFESHYLLSWSPGEVAKKLNSIAGLDIIDRMVSVLNKRLSRTKNTLFNTEENLKSEQKVLEEYKYVGKLKKAAKFVRTQLKTLKEQRAKADKLKQTRNKLSQVEAQLIELRWVSLVEEKVQELLVLSDSYDAYSRKSLRIASLLKKLRSVEASIVAAEKVAEASNTTQKLVSLYEDYRALLTKKERMNVCVLKIKEIEKKFAVLSRAVNESEEEYKEAMDNINVCPLCGREM